MEAPPGFVSYHGSPHSFDRFDISKIGTGEGNQAYGHGLYVAENEGVARGYRDALTPQPKMSENMLVNGKTIDELLPDVHPTVRSLIMGGIATHGGDVGAALDAWGSRPGALSAAAAKAAEHLRGADVVLPKPAGHMYEVQVNADPEHFLHWDKPLSEQSQHVQDRIQQVMDANPDMAKSLNFQRDFLGKSPTGEGVYSALSGWKRGSQLSADAQAAADVSQRLRDAGIPGIRYLDQGSRAAGEGTHNHVIFDADTMKIIRQFGIAGLMAGAGAYGATKDNTQ